MGGNVVIQGKVVDDRTIVKEIEVDRSGSLITITHEHSKVHQGRFFGAQYYDSAVVNTGTLDLLIQTAANKSLHTYIKLLVGGDAVFQLYEGTTFSAAGTAVDTINHNRTSSEVCTCTVTHTPTVTDVGTELWEEFVPGGTSGAGGAHTPGGIDAVSSEQWIFNNGTDYLLRVTNAAGSTQPIQIVMAYYSVDV